MAYIKDPYADVDAAKAERLRRENSALVLFAKPANGYDLPYAVDLLGDLVADFNAQARRAADRFYAANIKNTMIAVEKPGRFVACGTIAPHPAVPEHKGVLTFYHRTEDNCERNIHALLRGFAKKLLACQRHFRDDTTLLLMADWDDAASARVLEFLGARKIDAAPRLITTAWDSRALSLTEIDDLPARFAPRPKPA